LAAKDYFAYQGKSLRLNLDGSIPDDNPEIAGVRSHVFTYGHRNMQGIAFGPDGTLYASEQGPKTDDEVNILTSGGNYGWPHVVGYQDDQAYQYARWAESTAGCDKIEFSDIKIDDTVPREDETKWLGPFNPPLATLFTVPTGWNFEDPACGGMNFICWPTVAASSIEVYNGGIPGFDHALLVTALMATRSPDRWKSISRPTTAIATRPSAPMASASLSPPIRVGCMRPWRVGSVTRW